MIHHSYSVTYLAMYNCKKSQKYINICLEKLKTKQIIHEIWMNIRIVKFYFSPFFLKAIFKLWRFMSKKIASNGGSNFNQIQNKYWHFFWSFHNFFKKQFLKILMKIENARVEFSLEKIKERQIRPKRLYNIALAK